MKIAAKKNFLCKLNDVWVTRFVGRILGSSQAGRKRTMTMAFYPLKNRLDGSLPGHSLVSGNKVRGDPLTGVIR